DRIAEHHHVADPPRRGDEERHGDQSKHRHRLATPDPKRHHANADRNHGGQCREFRRHREAECESDPPEPRRRPLPYRPPHHPAPGTATKATVTMSKAPAARSLTIMPDCTTTIGASRNARAPSRLAPSPRRERRAKA